MLADSARYMENNVVDACRSIARPINSCLSLAVTPGTSVQPVGYPMMRSRSSGFGSTHSFVAVTYNIPFATDPSGWILYALDFL